MLRRRSFLVGVVGGGAALAGCAGVRHDGGNRTTQTQRTHTAAKFTTSAFEDGGHVPAKFTCSGTDRSPPLSISSIPGDAKSLAVIVDDPDAPSGIFTHWLLWNLPPDTRHIPGDVPNTKTVESLGGARQGTNGFGKIGYRGPCPPKGDGSHTYRFTLYLLDKKLGLEAGAKREALLNAMDGKRRGSTRFTAEFGRG